MEEPESKEAAPLIEIDQEQIIQAPTASQKSTADRPELSRLQRRFPGHRQHFHQRRSPGQQRIALSRDIDESDLAESEVDILKSESLFLEEEDFYEIEKADPRRN